MSDPRASRKRKYRAADAMKRPNVLEDLGHLKGKSGILVITERAKERSGAREALSMLEALPLARGGAAGDAAAATTTTTAAASVSKQISLDLETATSTEDDAAKFVETGSDCLVLLTNVHNPTDAVHAVFDRLLAAGKLSSRFVEKLLPLERICNSSLDAIVKVTAELLQARMNSGPAPATFAVVQRIRSCGHLERTALIDAVAGLVDQNRCKVDLAKPDMVVLVDAMKNIAGVSVLDGERFRAHAKFSVRLLLKPASATAEDRAE
jgi:hypothetical protein